MHGGANATELCQSRLGRVGLLPFLLADNRPRFLLLRAAKLRSPTSSRWKLPTGELQKGEPLLAQAARLGREVTGLNPLAPDARLQAPYTLTGDANVVLCPCRFGAKRLMQVQASGGHDAHAWVSLEELRDLLRNDTEADRVLTVLSEVERCEMAAAGAERQRREVIDLLSASLRDEAAGLGCSWYLAGSLAAAEHTVLSERLLSDLDLVAVGRIPTRQRRAEIRRRIGAYLSQMSLGRGVHSFGLYFLGPAEAVSRCEPFWSYFASHHSGLTETATHHALRWQGQLRPDAGTRAYQAFRLIWYAALPGIAEDAAQQSYRAIKREVMASILKELWEGQVFRGYAKHRERLLRRAVAKNGDQVLSALSALDVKLNLRPFPDQGASCGVGGAWAEELLQRVRGPFPASAMLQGAMLLAKDAFAMPQSLRRLVGSSLGQGALALWNHALACCHREVVWLLLIGLRLALWPREVRFSHRYAGLVSRLSQQAMEHTCCASQVRRLVLGFDGNSWRRAWQL